jgi:hypothetical protein
VFEHRSSPLLPRQAFYRRVAICFLLSQALIVVALGIGMAGYHGFEGMSWLDAYLNAAMILTGMGPVSPLQTTGGKLFAGGYALFCGLVILGAASLLLTPVFHRIIHKFHIEDHGPDHPARCGHPDHAPAAPGTSANPDQR